MCCSSFFLSIPPNHRPNITSFPPFSNRWEKFAKEKGILKKKKERMVWSESEQKFVPRWGYKAPKGGIEEHGFLEIKTGQDPFTDPFAVQKKERDDKKTKNMTQQIRNLGVAGIGKMKSVGKGARAARPNKKHYDMYDAAKQPGIPVDITEESTGRMKGKAGVHSTLQLVQQSTASMGRFDEMRKGEPGRKIKGRKQAYKDNISIGTDKVGSKFYSDFRADRLLLLLQKTMQKLEYTTVR